MTLLWYVYKHVLSLSVVQKALMADIAATRELCVQLDHSKDSLTRQLASHAAAYEQVGGASSEQTHGPHLLHACIYLQHNTSKRFLGFPIILLVYMCNRELRLLPGYHTCKCPLVHSFRGSCRNYRMKEMP